MGEAGYRKLVLDNFFGLSGPPKMPADVVARLNTECNEILAPRPGPLIRSAQWGR